MHGWIQNKADDVGVGECQGFVGAGDSWIRTTGAASGLHSTHFGRRYPRIPYCSSRTVKRLLPVATWRLVEGLRGVCTGWHTSVRGLASHTFADTQSFQLYLKRHIHASLKQPF